MYHPALRPRCHPTICDVFQRCRPWPPPLGLRGPRPPGQQGCQHPCPRHGRQVNDSTIHALLSIPRVYAVNHDRTCQNSHPSNNGGRCAANPTTRPSSLPTEAPSEQPSRHPTRAPTGLPTGSPTTAPTGKEGALTCNSTMEALHTKPTWLTGITCSGLLISGSPTRAPTGRPTGSPTAQPTQSPSAVPTGRAMDNIVHYYKSRSLGPELLLTLPGSHNVQTQAFRLRRQAVLLRAGLQEGPPRRPQPDPPPGQQVRNPFRVRMAPFVY